MRNAAVSRLIVLVAPLVAALGCGEDGEGGPAGPGVTVKVMTRNLYLGADLLPVVTATTVDEIPTRVAMLWKTMLDSDLPGRAKLLADEIAAAEPDLVGLQEAVVFYKQLPSDHRFANMSYPPERPPSTQATQVQFDFVQLLLTELAARMAEYEAVAISEHSDVELPASDPAGAFDVRMVDRDVILARKGLTITDRKSTRYMAHLPFTIPIGSNVGAMVDLVRGLVRVDAVVEGAPFSFANTHLEVSGGPNNILDTFQESQANELVALLDPIKGPLVLVGDFNSAPEPPTTKSYATVAAKLTDAYAKVSPGMPGYTCCTDIQGAAATPKQRIDIVFFRGGVSVQAVELVGLDPSKRNSAGLWPSDHAGVVATLQIAK